MNIKIKNVGIINNADIQIRGFTIIAGKNDTGKSTVSKSLYAIFSCFSGMKAKVNELVKERINQKINEVGFYLTNLKKITSLANIKNKLYEHYIKKSCTKETIKEVLLNESTKNDVKVDKERLEYIINDIYNIVSLHYDNYVKHIRQRYFDIEFSNQIANVNQENPTEVLLDINGKEYKLEFSNNKLNNIKEEMDFVENIVYYDSEQDISAFNTGSNWETYSSINYSHVQDLINKLKLEDSKIKFYDGELLNNFSSYFGNHNYKNILIEDGAIVVTSDNYKKNISIENLSSGAKVILILKKLILSDFFKDNNLIIFDEPETHLHPEWQIALANALVFLQKKFKLKILLSSHSPYFIGALETAIEFNNLKDETDYYLFERVNNSIVTNHVNNNIDLIYDTLDKPLDEIIGLRESAINE